MTDKDLTGLGEMNALLGRGTRYEGKLTFEGRVRIDGAFRGEIFSEAILVVGDGADIEASIEVGTLIVRGGTVRGTIKAKRLVELHASARIHADIEAPQLYVDRGALFDGKCTMPEARISDLGEHPLERQSE